MKVLDFGSVNIDFVYRVPYFVRPGETLTAFEVTRNAGGKGFNQSVALAKAGCDVYHAGHIGEDGRFLVELLEKYGVHTDYLTECQTSTGNAFIQVDDSGANCIILYGGANQTMNMDFIQTVLADFRKGDMIVLQNEINCINEIIALAHDAELYVVVNPAPMNDAISREKLKLADMIILNETEALALTGVEEPYAQLETLRIHFPHSTFLLTLGIKGAMYQDFTGTYTIGVCKVDAVDTTAAGDTFAGFFLAALSGGGSPEDALVTATKASALAVMKAGAAQSIPSLADVRNCDLVPGSIQM